MAGLEHYRFPLSDVSGFHKHVSSLTESQKEFVVLLNDWFRGGRKEFLFAIVTGGPGCGKTHAVVETLRFLNPLRVAKMSYTARLALRIGGTTVHSAMGLTKERGALVKEVWDRLEHSEDVEECLRVSARLDDVLHCRHPADVVVVDEIGMLPFWLTYRMGLYFRDRYAAVEGGRRTPVAMICMGDDRQLRPVKSRLNAFHVDFERLLDARRIEMKESKRFTPEYGAVVDRLRQLMELRPEEEEDPANHPLFGYLRETFPIAQCVTQEMMLRASFVLAFKNETVAACNDFYLNVIMSHERGYEFPALDWSGKRVARDDRPENRRRLRKNCTVVVTENGCGENLCNGTTLKFLDYDPDRDQVVCADQQTGRAVRVNRGRYEGKQIPLVPGFAVTIHKFQGETINDDSIIICFDRSTDLNLIYTALSRVRDMSQIMAVVL